jgi:hypothetical protein
MKVDRKTAAFHEAGHAVAALTLGHSLKTVAMDRNRSEGEVTTSPMSDRDHAIVALAGPIAMSLYLGVPLDRTLPLGCIPDFGQAIEKLNRPSQAKFSAAIGDAAQLICDQWGTVQRIAKGLLQQGSLNHNDVINCAAGWESPRWEGPNSFSIHPLRVRKG